MADTGGPMIATAADDVIARIIIVGALGAVTRIAREHGVSLETLVSRDRHRHAALARHHAWAVIRWTLALSYPEIGRMFGVDHCTVIQGIRKFERHLSEAA